MTTTLLLRLAAPRQSWGEVGTERHRTTSKIPTYSGLIGLLNACLGMRRGENNPLLRDIGMTVRVDRAGVLETDFQTVSPPPADLAAVRRRSSRLRTYSRTQGRADFTVPLGDGKPWEVGEPKRPVTHVSERQYLADAEFFAAFTGTDETIAELADAVRRPVFSPYLGRQAFAPAFPFHLGARAGEGLPVLERLATTAPEGKLLRVHELSPGRPVQIARIDPPRTHMPLIAWRNP